MATQDAVRGLLKKLGETVGSAELKQIAFEIFKADHRLDLAGDGCAKYTDEGSCMEQDPERPDRWCALCANYVKLDNENLLTSARDFQAIPVC